MFVPLVISHPVRVLAATAADVADVLGYSVDRRVRKIPGERGRLDWIVRAGAGMATRGCECGWISAESMAVRSGTSVAMTLGDRVLMEMLVGVVDAAAEAQCQRLLGWAGRGHLEGCLSVRIRSWRSRKKQKRPCPSANLEAGMHRKS